MSHHSSLRLYPFAGSLAVACLISFSTCAVAQNRTDKEKRVASLTNEVLDELIEKRFGDLAKRFTSKMLEALPEEKLKPTLGQLDLITGAYKSKGKIKTLSDEPLTVEAEVLHERSMLVYRLSFDDEDRLAGLFVRPARLPSLEEPKKDPNAAYDESEVQLDRNGITFGGTLCLPKEQVAASPWPLLIFHSGSGPTDRNSNGPLMRTDAIQKLARKLATNGIASVRYDKRGSGETPVGVDESELTPGMLVDDYAAWSTQLAKDERFSRQFLAGHSEGAQLAFRAASGNQDIAAVISIAGSGRPIDQLLRSQLKGKISEDLFVQVDDILKELAQGRMVKEVPSELQSVIRPSVQPYLIDFIRRPPVEDAAALRIPVLIVQGNADIQIAVRDAELLDEACSKSTMKIVERMNHVLVEIDSPSEQVASYQQPEMEISEELVSQITDFVRAVGGTGGTAGGN